MEDMAGWVFWSAGMESYELTRSTAEPFLSPLLLHFPMTLGKKKNPHFIGLFFFFLNHTLWNTVLILCSACLMMSIWVCGYRN